MADAATTPAAPAAPPATPRGDAAETLSLARLRGAAGVHNAAEVIEATARADAAERELASTRNVVAAAREAADADARRRADREHAAQTELDTQRLKWAREDALREQERELAARAQRALAARVAHARQRVAPMRVERARLEALAQRTSLVVGGLIGVAVGAVLPKGTSVAQVGGGALVASVVPTLLALPPRTAVASTLDAEARTLEAEISELEAWLAAPPRVSVPALLAAAGLAGTLTVASRGAQPSRSHRRARHPSSKTPSTARTASRTTPSTR